MIILVVLDVVELQHCTLHTICMWNTFSMILSFLVVLFTTVELFWTKIITGICLSRLHLFSAVCFCTLATQLSKKEPFSLLAFYPDCSHAKLSLLL